MAERKINPITKLVLEIGPVVLFFALYLRLRERSFEIAGTEYSGFILVTAIFVPIMALTTLILYRLTGKLARMQLATVIIVVIFGGLTIWFNDERFFKMKPTIIYLLFAATLGLGLLRGRSYLEFMMGDALPLKPEGWMILTRRITLFFLGLAVLNEVIWRTMSTDAWVNFKTFGLTIAIFAFFMTQGRVFSRFAVEDGDKENADRAPDA